VVDRLREEERTPGGILSPRLMESGRTIGYDVVDLATGNRRNFVRTNPPGKKVGKYFIKPGSLEFANRSISEAVDEFSPVFVDEVGRLELKNEGLAPSVRKLLSSNTQAVLLVRDEFLPEVRDFFDIQEYDVVRVS
jgi:nucleoside-triphosphatase